MESGLLEGAGASCDEGFGPRSWERGEREKLAGRVFRRSG